jgi:hypothetical protein
MKTTATAGGALISGAKKVEGHVMTLQAHGKIEVESDQAWVVYDAKTGRIHHVHRVVTLKGGTQPESSDVEARVMDIVATKGGKVSQLKTLVVSPEQLHPGATHKVDVKKKSLVSKPIKQDGKRPTKRSK